MSFVPAAVKKPSGSLMPLISNFSRKLGYKPVGTK